VNRDDAHRVLAKPRSLLEYLADPSDREKLEETLALVAELAR
jgi:hypothetical protein